MKKEFLDKERKQISGSGSLFVFIYILACYLAISEHYMPVIYAPLVLIAIFVILYIAFGKYSAIEVTKDRVLCSVVSTLLVGSLVVGGWIYTHPKIEELKAEAVKADEQYFFLSGASLDHSKICAAGIKAFKLHERTGNKERAELIGYGLIQDKCF
ncbi:hypothetical protein [Acinetobacter pittii]|uniref:hypothetical protein n=1 Tax=Acinetobacter pittii TaxID=48296 RepID=UPI00300A468A